MIGRLVFNSIFRINMLDHVTAGQCSSGAGKTTLNSNTNSTAHFSTCCVWTVNIISSTC